jgi:hypothetical protein
MWDLNTIVRLNDEAQRRADAIREYDARERQANEPEFAGTVVGHRKSQREPINLKERKEHA